MLQQSAGHSLDQVVTAFSEKVAELRELILLRTDSAASDLESSELAQLDSSIQVAESKLQGIQRCISQEKQAISQAKVLITACAAQSDQLQYIESHLPARLPEASALSSQQPLGASVSAEDRPTDSVPNTNENVDSTNLEVQPVPAKQLAGDKKKRAKAPRRYISQAELTSLSSYMRGRLTIETINAALDDAASHSEANSKLMTAARSNSVKPSDRTRATTLLHCVAGKEGIRGKFWFVESDLKGGTALKLDKTGKAILTVLRHLSRLAEVRVSLDGTPQVAYVLQAE